MRSHLLLLAILVILFLLLPAAPASAGWIEGGVPLYVGGDAPTQVVTVTDGGGGAFASWYNTVSGRPVHIIHVNADGNAVWPANGIPVTASDYGGYQPSLAADGAGGVYVVWTDDRGADYDIYAQHLDGDGNRLWGADGAVVNNSAADQQSPVMITDDFGNIIVCWQDYTYGAGDIDLYAQRLDFLGNRTWGTNGVTVSAAYGNQVRVVMIHDTLFGAIIAWQDLRSATEWDVYAQRLDNSGVAKWTMNGQAVCTAVDHQSTPALVTDGNGGAICAWADERSGSYRDVYAQRLKVQGGVDWQPDGIPIGTSDDEDLNPSLAPAPDYGAIIAWSSGMPSGPPHWDVHVNRLNGDGFTLWAYNGIAITDHGNAGSFCMTPINDDTYVVAFEDRRDDFGDIYAQAFNLNGRVLWEHNGTPICTVDGTQSFQSGEISRPILGDQTGGAIVAWLDYRTGRIFDIYAQRIEPRYGEWGRPEPAITEVSDSPGDQGGYVVVRWHGSDRDRYPQTLITHYSVWRAMEPPEEGFAASAADDAAFVSSPGAVGKDFKGRALWIETRAGAQQFWEWVGNQNAQWQGGYSYTTATRGDSSAAGPAEHFFKVMAHTPEQFTFWESNQAGGHSIDNLAPAPPLMLAAERVGNYVRLDWTPSGADEPDFGEYVLYRRTSAGVDPEPINFLSTSRDTTFWDEDTPPGVPYYYVVTAKDVHGNQSPPSNEANVDGSATGTGTTPALTSLQVLGNVPNPFTGTTRLRIGMPAASEATIEVFDVAGRRALTTRTELMAGWQDVSLDARSLPSGVYFCRVSSAGMAVTKKMVVAR